jgi:hypothetical protein
VPEGARLKLGEEYRKLLLELFKGLLTLTRETHIKQLEMALTGMAWAPRGPVIPIAPELAAEPLVTFYLRRALGYRFVRGVLEEAFGPKALEHMARLTAEGPCARPLAEELTGIEQLFAGAHVAVARQLGMAPDARVGDAAFAAAAVDCFQAWSRRQAQDPDLGQDVRAMVPVFYDLGRKRTKVWAFMGWSQRPVTIAFARPPEAVVLTRLGRPARRHPPIQWDSLHALLAYPVMAELYVDRILNRAEFRQLCDECRTRSELLRRLGAPPPPRPSLPERDPACVCAECGWQPLLSPADVRPNFCTRCGGPMVTRMRR